MENQNFLGIYLRKETASVVCIEPNDDKGSIVDAFFVSIEDQEEHNIPVLVNLIGQKIAEKGIQYSQIAVAIDCAMFIQHKIHSDFTDAKQMAQTIRFDAEEILARDVSNVAIAFKINSSNETGSELTIFTVEKDLLADIIAALQSNRMDPVTIEPDAYCLKRFLSEQLDISQNTLFTVLSKHNTYIVPMGPSEHLQQIPPRTFLLDIKRDRTQALQREIPITIALLEPESIDSLKVFDSINSLDLGQLHDNLTVETECVNLPELINLEQQADTSGGDPTGFILAYGAAISLVKQTETIDFRSDFLPYQGKKQKLQNAIRYLSISCTILLFVIGVFLQTRWFQGNKPIKELQKRSNADYKTIMGRQPDKRRKPLTSLKDELGRIKREKSGQLSGTGSKSLSGRLTRILLGINKCAAQTNLIIDSINISTKTITIAGSTSNRSNTENLRKSLEANGLKIAKDSVQMKAGRDNFRLTIETKN
ncbi:MAG: hypothetical protein ACYTFM_01505 [Planctomycetota bacterium]